MAGELLSKVRHDDAAKLEKRKYKLILHIILLASFVIYISFTNIIDIGKDSDVSVPNSNRP